MRLAIPVDLHCVQDLVTSPQSIDQPVGWQSLLELGPHATTIANKCRIRGPHCQMAGARLRMGIECAIAGRSSLMSDFQLREFTIERPWTEKLSREIGPEAYQI